TARLKTQVVGFMGVNMMRNWLLPAALVAALGLGVLLGVPTPAAEPADATKIAKLIEQIGSGNFDEREQATAELDKIGAPALAALKKAMTSGDAEVKRRAEELVAKIEKRTESVTLLVPTKVKLSYKDTPVTEAVAD